MLRKLLLVWLILEYFTSKTGTLKILPPPPPLKKNNNNTDQGGVVEGATMMLNSSGVSAVHKKV